MTAKSYNKGVSLFQQQWPSSVRKKTIKNVEELNNYEKFMIGILLMQTNFTRFESLKVKMTKLLVGSIFHDMQLGQF